MNDEASNEVRLAAADLESAQYDLDNARYDLRDRFLADLESGASPWRIWPGKQG